MCFLIRCSGILNICANYVHTNSGKPQKFQGKLFFPFNSVNVSLKYQHQLQQKLCTAEIWILCFRNLSHFRILNQKISSIINFIVLFGINYLVVLSSDCNYFLGNINYCFMWNQFSNDIHTVWNELYNKIKYCLVWIIWQKSLLGINSQITLLSTV